MNSEIFSLLHRLGITPNYAGYFQTAQAVELCVEDPERLTLVTKLVYAEVGKRYGASWKTVERNIRTVSIIAWERSLPALEELMGCPPGSASVLGMAYDTGHRVRLLMDRPVYESEWIGCHPCKSDASLRIQPDNAAVMYDKAAALKAQGQEDEADDLFGQIIDAYPDTDYAVMSREQRGY